ncbi:hypothetical protein DFH08DRAFT_817399 [Mycena albidolilacea]|uniref:Uncharacterized protein n=1 Tax=Mycena albidolilacea TaxID=1033008 RepID=A0AAD7EGY2_9AGAR|nr:hypothetical protein DFH08DRAFT_817399 [Mycena albidolilacea]
MARPHPWNTDVPPDGSPSRKATGLWRMSSTGEMNYAIPNFRSRCSTPMLTEVNGKVTANSNAIGTREGARGSARAACALLRRHLAVAARAVAATAAVAAAGHGLRRHDSQGGSHLPLWPEPFQIYLIQVAMSGVGSHGRYGNTHNHQREAQVRKLLRDKSRDLTNQTAGEVECKIREVQIGSRDEHGLRTNNQRRKSIAPSPTSVYRASAADPDGDDLESAEDVCSSMRCRERSAKLRTQARVERSSESAEQQVRNEGIAPKERGKISLLAIRLKLALWRTYKLSEPRANGRWVRYWCLTLYERDLEEIVVGGSKRRITASAFARINTVTPSSPLFRHVGFCPAQCSGCLGASLHVLQVSIRSTSVALQWSETFPTVLNVLARWQLMIRALASRFPCFPDHNDGFLGSLGTLFSSAELDLSFCASAEDAASTERSAQNMADRVLLNARNVEYGMVQIRPTQRTANAALED